MRKVGTCTSCGERMPLADWQEHRERVHWRNHRNGHTLELRSTYWRCLQCGHRFEVVIDADLFWCGDDCKHPAENDEGPEST